MIPNGSNTAFAKLLVDPQRGHLTWTGPEYQPLIETGMHALADEKVIERIWAHDHTVWKPDPAEIENRLGWLTVAEKMTDVCDDLTSFADEIRGFAPVLR